MIISQLQSIGQESIGPAIAKMSEWLRRAVSWIKVQYSTFTFPEVKIESKLGGTATLFAANLVIFQLAFRIANLIDPEGNHCSSRPGEFHFHLGAVFSIGYGLGLFALTKVLKVSLDNSAWAAVHLAAFVGGCFLTMYSECY